MKEMCIKDEEFSFWKNRSVNNFNYWIKNCQGKNIKKQVKILNNREQYLGIYYMFNLLDHIELEIIKLFAIKLILKKYRIKSIINNEKEWRIKDLMVDGIFEEIEFILKSFPLIENDLMKYSVKLIKSKDKAARNANSVMT